MSPQTSEQAGGERGDSLAEMRGNRADRAGLIRAPDEATAYGGGALWLANLRFVACLDPRTGAVRASEQVGRSPKVANRMIDQFQAIDPATHAI